MGEAERRHVRRRAGGKRERRGRDDAKEASPPADPRKALSAPRYEPPPPRPAATSPRAATNPASPSPPLPSPAPATFRTS